MALPITPNGNPRRRSRPRQEQPESDPNILDLDGDHHTVMGDWVEDNPTAINDSSPPQNITMLTTINIIQSCL